MLRHWRQLAGNLELLKSQMKKELEGVVGERAIFHGISKVPLRKGKIDSVRAADHLVIVDEVTSEVCIIPIEYITQIGDHKLPRLKPLALRPAPLATECDLEALDGILQACRDALTKEAPVPKVMTHVEAARTYIANLRKGDRPEVPAKGERIDPTNLRETLEEALRIMDSYPGGEEFFSDEVQFVTAMGLFVERHRHLLPAEEPREPTEWEKRELDAVRPLSEPVARIAFVDKLGDLPQGKDSPGLLIMDEVLSGGGPMPNPRMTELHDLFWRIIGILKDGQFTKDELDLIERSGQVVVDNTRRASGRGPISRPSPPPSDVEKALDKEIQRTEEAKRKLAEEQDGPGFVLVPGDPGKIEEARRRLMKELEVLPDEIKKAYANTPIDGSLFGKILVKGDDVAALYRDDPTDMKAATPLRLALLLTRLQNVVWERVQERMPNLLVIAPDIWPLVDKIEGYEAHDVDPKRHGRRYVGHLTRHRMGVIVDPIHPASHGCLTCMGRMAPEYHARFVVLEGREEDPCPS